MESNFLIILLVYKFYRENLMDNYCINCGKDLRNAPYTLPWEDGDNEEGYWICPRCHTKNIDWSSSDDD